LEELKLGQSEHVDQATAVRTGLLLSAGNIVQGQIGGGEDALRLEALVVPVARGGDAPAPAVEEAVAQELFRMEKQLALGIFQSLGIQLTDVERERVLRQPTRSLVALLEYGRGLDAEAGGDYARAARHFRDAIRHDPAFREARERAVEASGIAAADSYDALAEHPSSPIGIAVSPFVTQSLPELDQLLGQFSDPVARDPGAEVLGVEGLISPAILRITFRRPGGQ
jgi:hypothetical protein